MASQIIGLRDGQAVGAIACFSGGAPFPPFIVGVRWQRVEDMEAEVTVQAGRPTQVWGLAIAFENGAVREQGYTVPIGEILMGKGDVLGEVRDKGIQHFCLLFERGFIAPPVQALPPNG